jgi:hypothetical protein
MTGVLVLRVRSAGQARSKATQNAGRHGQQTISIANSLYVPIIRLLPGLSRGITLISDGEVAKQPPGGAKS